MKLPITIVIAKPSDARGWIGLGAYTLVLLVFAMIYWSDKDLLSNDAFLILATAVIITGWVNGPVGWAYQATKSGGDLAESQSRIAENATGTSSATDDAAAGARQVADKAETEAEKIERLAKPKE